MSREYRVLSKLCEVFPPAPRPYLFCDDQHVIGDDFYVMERRTGVVIRATPPEELVSDPALVRGVGESLVNCLADLHSVDYRAAGLADLGRPEGYIQRQVEGWTKRYENSKTDQYDSMDRIATWLSEHMPPDGRPSLIHNDFKHDNLMLDNDDLTRVIAVLDWEMATIGDPLMDLGMTLAYWVQADDHPAIKMATFGPTCLEGSLNRQQVAELYASRTGVDIDNILFYYCSGLYKLAVIAQQIYARYVRGATKDARFAGLNHTVAAMGETGVRAIESAII
jgi:aminoglycoside phosphotransferase (APT) family kinase protein